MTSFEDARLLERIEAHRAENNRLWMALVRLALEAAPAQARQLLAEITAHDRAISGDVSRLTEVRCPTS